MQAALKAILVALTVAGLCSYYLEKSFVTTRAGTLWAAAGKKNATTPAADASLRNISYAARNSSGSATDDDEKSLPFMSSTTINNNPFAEFTFTEPIFQGTTTRLSQNTTIISESDLHECVTFVQEASTLPPIQPAQPAYEGYSLGDCIKLCRKCDMGPAHSLAVQYGQMACRGQPNKNCTRTSNLTILQNLLRTRQDRPGYYTPNPHVVVIHLRLGDVLEFSRQANVTLMLTAGASPRHSRNFRGAIRSVYQYLGDLQKSSSVKAVEIVGGSHVEFTNKGGKSRPYAHCLQYALHRAGYRTSLRIGGIGPDEDFYYISHAKRVMVSTGGFSRLMGQLVVELGGEIIGPTY